MAIPDARLQDLINAKDAVAALASCKKHGYSEGWSIIDGALVIYDLDSPPAWLAPVLRAQDEDGNTPVSGVTLLRAPRPGEYVDPQPVMVPMDAGELAPA